MLCGTKLKIILLGENYLISVVVKFCASCYAVSLQVHTVFSY